MELTEAETTAECLFTSVAEGSGASATSDLEEGARCFQERSSRWPSAPWEAILEEELTQIFY
jgi:hypothetical protein